MPEVEISRQKHLRLTKDKFLKNFKNKDGLIKLLILVFAENGIRSEQAPADADTLVVKRAIHLSSQGAVNVIANDTDVLILFLHHRTQFKDFIYLTTDKTTHDICGIVAAMTEREKKYILLGHCLSGCDTVSSLFGFGKLRLYNFVASDKNTPTELLDVFMHPTSSTDSITEAGVRLFEILFIKQQQSRQTSGVVGQSRGTSRGRPRSRGRSGRRTTSRSVTPTVTRVPLSDLRYCAYNKMCAKGVVRPERLPPTDGAVKQHSLRVYLQVHDWTALECTSLNPLMYGWQTKSGIFTPTGTLDSIAPDSLRNLISCGCKTGCKNTTRSCRRNNMRCVPFCINCAGSDSKIAILNLS